MSLVVNIIFEVRINDYPLLDGEDSCIFSHIEDAKSGEVLHIGHWVQLEDELIALQLRVMHLDEHLIDGLNICPCCSREIPPPPPDLTWKRSLP